MNANLQSGLVGGLPLCDDGVARLCGVEERAAVALGNATAKKPPSPVVLVVDDEALIRQVAVRILRRGGFAAEEASGGREALTMMENARRRFDAVLLDLTMPQMDGAQTLLALLERDPATRVVVMSGYGEHDTLSQFGGAVAGFLGKPFTSEMLLGKVREVLAT